MSLPSCLAASRLHLRTTIHIRATTDLVSGRASKSTMDLSSTRWLRLLRLLSFFGAVFPTYGESPGGMGRSPIKVRLLDFNNSYGVIKIVLRPAELFSDRDLARPQATPEFINERSSSFDSTDNSSAYALRIANRASTS